MQDLSQRPGFCMLRCIMSRERMPEGLEKKCTKCGQVKPVSAFYFHKQNGRYRPSCKDCVNAHSKDVYAADPGAKLASNKRYRVSNPDKSRAYTKKSLSRFAPGGYRHRMTQDEWDRRWQEQDGKCYLCGQALTEAIRICIEHDHRCCGPDRSCERCRRGLACVNCNSVVGLAWENPAVLHRIAENLESAQALVEQAMAENGRGLDSWTDSRRKYATPAEAHQAQLQVHSRWERANREQINVARRDRYARRKAETS